MIQKNVKSRDESAYKLAIIEADKLIDHILDMANGEDLTLDEHLEKMNEGQIQNIEDLKRVHTLATHIVNDAEFVVSHEEAKNAVQVYYDSLNSLDVNL